MKTIMSKMKLFINFMGFYIFNKKYFKIIRLSYMACQLINFFTQKMIKKKRFICATFRMWRRNFSYYEW